MIPKLSAPLTKLIRTLEGVIWTGANVALVLAPIVSSHVSPADSIKYGSIMNAVMFVARQALKGLALAKGVGLPAPTQLISSGTLSKVEGDASAVAGDVAADVSKGASTEEILGQIADAEQAVSAVQAQPGAPAQEIASGLAPDPTGTTPGGAPAAPTTLTPAPGTSATGAPSQVG